MEIVECDFYMPLQLRKHWSVFPVFEIYQLLVKLCFCHLLNDDVTVPGLCECVWTVLVLLELIVGNVDILCKTNYSTHQSSEFLCVEFKLMGLIGNVLKLLAQSAEV